jgi:hypothetical protein
MTLMQTRAQLGNLFSNAEGKNLKKPVKTHAHTQTHTHISHRQNNPKKRWPYFIRGGVILSRVWRTLLRSGLLMRRQDFAHCARTDSGFFKEFTRVSLKT